MEVYSYLNMKQYNGKYGCTWCTNPGISAGPGHRLWPVGSDITMRSVPGYQRALQASLENQSEACKLGVIGAAPLQNILTSFPLTCAIDYMHTVCLGVTKRLLTSIYSSLSKSSAAQLDKIAVTIEQPSGHHFLRDIVTFNTFLNFSNYPITL